MFIQQLRKEKFEWDQPLPPQIRDEWLTIQNELCAASTDIAIKRQYFASGLTHKNPYELHVFCDSSIKAYGSVVYLRHRSETSNVMTKSRVAPSG
jgi:hypothetical protein